MPNIQGCTDLSGTSQVPQAIPYTATTVGSISDEKNDSFYWFISGLSTKTTDTLTVESLFGVLPISEINEVLAGTGQYLFKDIIMQARSSSFMSGSGPTVTAKPVVTCEPVFVDIWGFVVNNITASYLTDSFNIGSTDLSNLLQTGWIAASYTDSGIHSTATVSTVTEYIGSVPVEPNVIHTSNVVSVGYQSAVSLGVSWYGGSGWDWNGLIYIEVDPNNIDLELIGGSGYIPQVGDIIGNSVLDFNPNGSALGGPWSTVPPLSANHPGATFNAGNQAVTITNQFMLQLTDDYKVDREFYVYTTSHTISTTSSTPTNPAFLTWMNAGGFGQNNSNPMITPHYGFEVESLQATCHIDTSGLVYFDYLQSYHFNGLSVGDPIAYSYSYPNGGCIHDLQPAGTTPPYADGQIIINDCASPPTIIPPISLIPPNPWGGLSLIHI